MGKVESQRYWRMSKGESRSAGRLVTWASRRALNKEVGFGASKETDGFMRQLVDQSFLKFFTTSAGLGLLLVPRKALQAATGQVGTDHCEPCLPSLLRFIIEGQANLFDKIGEMRVGVTELAQQATLSDEDTAERRAILKKVGPIFLAP